MSVKYTKDGDRVIKTIINEKTQEVNLVKISERLERVKASLDNLPSLKDKPDKETLDFYNQEISIRRENELTFISIDIKELNEDLTGLEILDIFPDETKKILKQLEKIMTDVSFDSGK